MSDRRPRASQLATPAAHGGGAGCACAWLFACLCSVWGAQRASAQGLPLALFAPPAQAPLSLTIPDPAPAPHGTLHAGLALDYANGLLDRSVMCTGQAEPRDRSCPADGSAGTASARVSDLAQGTLLLDLALFDRLSLSFALPVALARAQVDGDPPATQLGLGDMRFAVNGAFVAHGPTKVGWSVAATFPSARANTWSGSRGVSIAPGVIVSREFGALTLGARVAYWLRERTLVLGIEQDDALLVGVGARYALHPQLAIVGDLGAQLGVGGHSFHAQESPAEIDLGLRLSSPGQTVSLDLGAGTAAWPGQRGAGAPDVRGFAVLRAALPTSSCAAGAEDYDGFEDADGCADPDNDRDGVPDELDACPDDPEDRDGFDDRDGCPDPDNDADGIPDARDLCPDKSEDRDGYQDQDGCPEPDNDDDGVPDGRDRCRLDPEDRDGFEDDDGCPEPGPGRPTVTVSGSRILLSSRVYFEDQADTLRAVSTPALDVLAQTIKSLPGRPRVRVEGHTDNTGNPADNLDLSYRRARAVVEYLKARGVPKEQLEYVGRGSAEPLAPNTTPEGRALNRRVEFVLIDR